MDSTRAFAWKGRVDPLEGPHATRVHQAVRILENAPSERSIALLGFCSDEGVRRNQGRVGARDGPDAIRDAFANLAWDVSDRIVEAGNVHCVGERLEAAQDELADRVCGLLLSQQRPLILGGGHETAWGTFSGTALAGLAPEIGIINLDAHFDLRPCPVAHSGTAFSQMAGWCDANQIPFRYHVMGIAEHANTQASFLRAKSLGVSWESDACLQPWNLAAALDRLHEFINYSGRLYLSIDLDVLPASVMPAVSAPAARGLQLESVLAVVDAIAKSGKLVIADLVELNPGYDENERGRRTAALIAWHLARAWSRTPK